MTISKSEIKTALLNSGYLLEDRINRVLNKKGWHTIPNTRFIDAKTQTEREIDVMALKNINDNTVNLDSIQSSLLIECMNNKEPIAFFENLEKQPNRIAALNYNVFNSYFGNILSFAQRNLNDQTKFTYSSQYCGFQKIQKLIKEFNNGWIASHPADKHNSLDSLFQFIKYHQKEFENFENSGNFISGFYYRAVIILQGELLSVKQKEDVEIDTVNHIKYQIPKTENNGRYFVIDVITEKYFSDYLKLTEMEDAEIAKMTLEHRDKLTF